MNKRIERVLNLMHSQESNKTKEERNTEKE